MRLFLMGKGYEQTFFQRKCQQVYEKVHITTQQGNANQNHREIVPHTHQNGYYQIDNKEELQRKIRRKRNPCTQFCWWELQVGQLLWKTVGSFLKELKIELPYDSAILLLSIYSKKTQTLISKDICILMFVSALFTLFNYESNLSITNRQ